MASTENSGPDNVVVIKVIGVGGAGNNAIKRMVESDMQGIEFIAVNTDKPALSQSPADVQLQIGAKITKGQGAGSDPEIGKRAAEENRNDIAKLLENTHMVFIACGMGGGTGTGAAPVIAEIARELNILTIGVVTKPFKFEGARRMRQAEDGITELIGKVDALFVIPNERLKNISTEKLTFLNSFVLADGVLHDAVGAISDLVTRTDMMNLDFADITTVMKNSGFAHMGVGRSVDKNKAEIATKMAIASDLMGTSIEGARGIIVHVMGSSELGLEEVDLAGDLVHTMVHPDATIIVGAGIDESMGDEMRVTVIATHFEDSMLVTKPIVRAGQTDEPLPTLRTAKPQPEPEPEPEPAPPPPSTPVQTQQQTTTQSQFVPEADDDPFEEIYKIFNK